MYWIFYINVYKKKVRAFEEKQKIYSFSEFVRVLPKINEILPNSTLKLHVFSLSIHGYLFYRGTSEILHSLSVDRSNTSIKDNCILLGVSSTGEEGINKYYFI